MTANKTDWMKAYEEKCSIEFIPAGFMSEDSQWHIDSYIQVSNGLEMINADSVNEFIKNLPKSKKILEQCKETHELQESTKSRSRSVPHRSVLIGSVIIKK